MDASWFNLAYQAIDILENQEKMHQFEVESYPHLKNEQRQKIHKDIYQRGWPNSFNKKSVVTLDEVARIMGMNNGQ